MTDIEASKIRSAFSNGFQYAFGNGSVENCNMDEVSRHAELLDEAIKKQMPAKPIKNRKETIRYTSVYSCPNCRRRITATGIADYCYHCGQCLDWSDFEQYLFGESTSKKESEDKTR